jgi:hypothetical protein
VGAADEREGQSEAAAPTSAGAELGPVAVCVLRLSRLGSEVHVSVCLVGDVLTRSRERHFETVRVEEALEAIRDLARSLGGQR